MLFAACDTGLRGGFDLTGCNRLTRLAAGWRMDSRSEWKPGDSQAALTALQAGGRRRPDQGGGHGGSRTVVPSPPALRQPPVDPVIYSTSLQTTRRLFPVFCCSRPRCGEYSRTCISVKFLEVKFLCQHYNTCSQIALQKCKQSTGMSSCLNPKQTCMFSISYIFDNLVQNDSS